MSLAHEPPGCGWGPPSTLLERDPGVRFGASKGRILTQGEVPLDTGVATSLVWRGAPTHTDMASAWSSDLPGLGGGGFDQPVHSLSVGPRKRVFLFCLHSNLIRIGYVPFFDIAHTGF